MADKVYVLTFHHEGEIASIVGVFVFRVDARLHAEKERKGGSLGKGRWSKWKEGETGPGTRCWNSSRGSTGHTIMEMELQ